VIPEGNNQKLAQSPSVFTSSLVQSQGTFSAFLAPLKKETFKQVASEVEDKLKVVNQKSGGKEWSRKMILTLKSHLPSAICLLSKR
jgi:hypothetical protein